MNSKNQCNLLSSMSNDSLLFGRQTKQLRKIKPTDKFPCWACYDDPSQKFTCKECSRMGFIYGSHPMVQFAEDYVQKKMGSIYNLAEPQNNSMENSSSHTDNTSICNSISISNDLYCNKFNVFPQKTSETVRIIDSTPQERPRQSEKQVYQPKLSNQSDMLRANQDQQQESQYIHYSTFCDGCSVTPIVGKRYSCKVCQDYDLCSSCYRKNIHNHEFKVIQMPDYLKRSMKLKEQLTRKSIKGKSRQTMH